jgi:hypothetical protein
VKPASSWVQTCGKRLHPWSPIAHSSAQGAASLAAASTIGPLQTRLEDAEEFKQTVPGAQSPLFRQR